MLQHEVSESQRELITANWGKHNLSRKGVEQAKQTMIAALTAASQGTNMAHLSGRTTSTSLAAEEVRLALEVSSAVQPVGCALCTQWSSCDCALWHRCGTYD